MASSKGKDRADGQPCRILGHFAQDGDFVPTKDGAGLVGRMDVVGNQVFVTIRRTSQSCDPSDIETTCHTLDSGI